MDARQTCQEQGPCDPPRGVLRLPPPNECVCVRVCGDSFPRHLRFCLCVALGSPLRPFELRQDSCPIGRTSQRGRLACVF